MFPVIVLIVVAAGCALIGGHSIATRSYRWGHRATMLYTGASGVLRGVAMLIVAAAFVIAAIVETRRPGFLTSGAWTSGAALHVTAILGGLVVALWGSATVIDRAQEERKSFLVTIPSRIAGALFALAGVAAVVWAVVTM